MRLGAHLNQGVISSMSAVMASDDGTRLNRSNGARNRDTNTTSLFVSQPSISDTSADFRDTRAFRVLTGPYSMNEAYPPAKTAKACKGLMSGKACFRAVLTTGL